ncbi:MAG TPA: mannose-6-phosphate isomerase, class I [Jatrophihabitantaceae bacterium]|nr:mannose-6-phosphate isomerase, class I [Jatrophihabitantaceae bacterium]
MTVPPVVRIEGVARDYAWGSTTAIQRVLGREPDGRPLAELWFGAHPDDPARVPDLGTTLDELIARDPVTALGSDVVERFGPQLPFLLKLLAADKPLSIQVHPTRAQAEAGFADEDARGIARDGRERNYRDRNHKPELLCALTEFEALCGFRPIANTLRLLDAFDLPELEPVRELLAGADPLRAAFTYLLRLPAPGPLVTAVAARAAAIEDAQWSGAAGAVLRAAEAFPGDVGAVLSLLLNHVVLQPGEAIFLGAGNVHAYLHGFGVEIMANSDNVLRCGLTSKHVDVEELLKITDFTELASPRWQPDHPDWFRVPVPDFELVRVDLDGYRKPGQDAGECATGDEGKPYLVLCASGKARVDTQGEVVALAPGQAAFVRSRGPLFLLRGTGQTFLATVQ